MRSKLYCVGGDSEVAISVNARERLVDEVHRDTLGRGERQWRRIELRMKATDGEHEVGVVSVGEQDAHRAGDRDEEDVRIEERRVEVEALLIEFEDTGEVDLENENRNIVCR